MTHDKSGPRTVVELRPLTEEEASFEGVHAKLDIAILGMRTVDGRITGIDRRIKDDVTPRLDSLDRGMFEAISLLKSIGGEVRTTAGEAAEAKRIAIAVREAPRAVSWTDEVVQTIVKNRVSAEAAETDIELTDRKDREIARAKMRANLVRLCYILGTILLAALARYLR